MTKMHRLWVAIATVTLLNLTVEPTTGAIAHTTQAKQQLQQPPSSASRFLNLFRQRRRERQEGARRGGICVLAPGMLQDSYAVWADQPIFLWQIEDPEQIRVNQIELLEDHPIRAQRLIIWQTELSSVDQAVLYDGEPLQPNQVYRWKLTYQRLNPNSNQWEDATTEGVFELMPPSERAAIAENLQQIATELRSSGASEEEIAIAKASRLVEQGWLMDGLQQMYVVNNPSPELVEARAELVTVGCESHSTDSLPEN